jgi:hypothetical protein
MKLYICREYDIIAILEIEVITVVAGIGYGFNNFATGSPGPEGLF